MIVAWDKVQLRFSMIYDEVVRRVRNLDSWDGSGMGIDSKDNTGGSVEISNVVLTCRCEVEVKISLMHKTSSLAEGECYEKRLCAR